MKSVEVDILETILYLLIQIYLLQALLKFDFFLGEKTQAKGQEKKNNSSSQGGFPSSLLGPSTDDGATQRHSHPAPPAPRE